MCQQIHNFAIKCTCKDIRVGQCIRCYTAGWRSLYNFPAKSVHHLYGLYSMCGMIITHCSLIFIYRIFCAHREILFWANFTGTSACSPTIICHQSSFLFTILLHPEHTQYLCVHSHCVQIKSSFFGVDILLFR